MSSIDPNSGLVGFDNIAFFTQKKCNPRYLSYYFKNKKRCKLCSLARNYTVKKVSDFPVSRRDVTNHALPGGE
jgi:hypothetical protein